MTLSLGGELVVSWGIACKKVLEDPAMGIVGHALGVQR
jgi:hypothetical protein